MMPSDLKDFKTKGEERFYKFLSAVAKPDTSYLVWYTPDLKGMEPDFILFSNTVGLIIFEVKDWVLEQIREANKYQFSLDKGGKVETVKNPHLQARDYIGELKDKIRSDGRLVESEGIHRGHPKIPIGYGVVFPNINKYEYIEKNLHSIIPVEKVFFWDDLHPDSDICRDPSGDCFINTLLLHHPPLFRCSATPKEIQHLRHLLFPEVRIELPKRGDAESQYEKEVERLRILDHNQEAFARQFDGGHRIIRGPSGSGKTLVLAHKAIFLKRYSPQIKRILFVCYNITLVNYVKRILAGKSIPIGESGVTVCHFFELCSWILGEKIPYEREDADFYEMVTREAFSKTSAWEKRFDAILVDEGQDFSSDMLRVIVSLLNPRTNSLTIALDERQNIYNPKRNWKEIGINARRVHTLSTVYRNSAEITELANRFIGEEQKQDKLNPRQMELFEDFFAPHGPVPELVRSESPKSMCGQIAATIGSLTRTQQYNNSDIAILYATKDLGAPETLPEMLRASLEGEGVLCQWVSEDYRSKKDYDVSTNRVTISTIHSAKGLDYALVFLVALDFLSPGKWSEEQIKCLIYVGVTRARYQLIIPYITATPAIQRLQACTQDLHKSGRH